MELDPFAFPPTPKTPIRFKLRSFIPEISGREEYVAAILAVAFAIILLAILWVMPEWRKGYLQGLVVEGGGAVFDLLLFGVLISFFKRGHERLQDIKRQEETLDDYKLENTPESKLRIAGALRRLERKGITKHDFRGLHLSDFSFRARDIRSIKGSVFNDGNVCELGSRADAVLDAVRFDYIDCSDVKFGVKICSRIPLESPMQILNCSFINADLSGANFGGAILKYSNNPPDELGGWEYDDDGHTASYEQYCYPPFHRANLRKATFTRAQLHNVDFRDAENILEADFRFAKGLDTCVFDPGVKEKILESN